MPVKTYFMDYSSIWSLFSHTRVNTGSSLQETSKLTYLPNFLTEYKSVAITGKYDNLCWGCEEKTWGNKKQNQNTHKKQTKKHNLEYFCFFFGIKFIDSCSSLVRNEPVNLSLLCCLGGFAYGQRWLVHIKAGFAISPAWQKCFLCSLLHLMHFVHLATSFSN